MMRILFSFEFFCFSYFLCGYHWFFFIWECELFQRVRCGTPRGPVLAEVKQWRRKISQVLLCPSSLVFYNLSRQWKMNPRLCPRTPVACPFHLWWRFLGSVLSLTLEQVSQSVTNFLVGPTFFILYRWGIDAKREWSFCSCHRQPSATPGAGCSLLTSHMTPSRLIHLLCCLDGSHLQIRDDSVSLHQCCETKWF